MGGGCSFGIPFTLTSEVSESTSAAGSEAIGRLSGNWPEEIRRVEDLIITSAEKYGLYPELYASLIYLESWYPGRCPDGPVTGSCTSSAGAIGPAQVMPYHFGEGENGRDPATNIAKGAEILRRYTDAMGTQEGGLAAYYCGPNQQYWINPVECWQYVDQVMLVFEKYVGEGNPFEA